MFEKINVANFTIWPELNSTWKRRNVIIEFSPKFSPHIKVFLIRTSFDTKLTTLTMIHLVSNFCYYRESTMSLLVFLVYLIYLFHLNLFKILFAILFIYLNIYSFILFFYFFVIFYAVLLYTFQVYTCTSEWYNTLIGSYTLLALE